MLAGACRDRYRRTLEIIESCHEVQLPVHINTDRGAQEFAGY